jgi:hypothetical protein
MILRQCEAAPRSEGEIIWACIASTRFPRAGLDRYEAVDLQLRDGSVVENLAIDASGIILGKIVDGQDGIDESPLPFKQEDTRVFRFRAALGARLGMTHWQTAQQSQT